MPSCRPIAVACALAALMLMGGCKTPSLFTPKATVYDGAWVGRFQMTVGTRECTMKRGGVRATVEGGEILGRARIASFSAPMTGFVDEAGQLRDGHVKGEFKKNNAEVIGTFGERKAEGTWKAKHCRGTWELTKVR